MAIYIPSVDGYIIDNPNIEFQRCDGKIYAYDEVNVANFTDTANSLIINGGQRRSPLSYVDTDRNTEISFTSSLFTLEMFEMANAENIETGDFSTIESKLLNVEPADETISYAPKSGRGARVQWELGTMPCIRLNYLIDPATVRIRGLSYQQNLIDEDSGDPLVPAGYFGVLVSKGELDQQKKRYYDYLPSIAVGDVWYTIILFNASDVALDDNFRVTYKRSIMSGDRVSTKTNGTTAKGSFWIHWPVYSSGADCTQSNQKGILHLWMPRCRITQTPGLDGSYKTAQAPGITAATIDPKRPDKKLFVLAYEDLTEIEVPDELIVSQPEDVEETLGLSQESVDCIFLIGAILGSHYQWQYAATRNGPWTDVGDDSPTVVIKVTHTNISNIKYVRCIVSLRNKSETSDIALCVVDEEIAP